MEFRGVSAQEKRLAVERERKGEIARAIVAAVLFALVIGIWTSLWVPAVPVF